MGWKKGEERAFPPPPERGRNPNRIQILQRGAFCNSVTSKQYRPIIFGAAARPLGSLQLNTPPESRPDPIVGLRPLPILYLLDAFSVSLLSAFGASILAPVPDSRNMFFLAVTLVGGDFVYIMVAAKNIFL